jgi:hypothetical protein
MALSKLGWRASTGDNRENLKISGTSLSTCNMSIPTSYHITFQNGSASQVFFLFCLHVYVEYLAAVLLSETFYLVN